MTSATSGIGAQQAQINTGSMLRDSGIGALIGMFVGNPVLGGLAGAAFNLFKTPGMADGMKQAAGNFTSGGSVQDIVKDLGTNLFGANEAGKTQADPDAAMGNAQQAEKKSGIPGWAKWLGGGALALGLFNNLFDNFSMGGFGNPLFGGFGMNPFGGMMDPMMGMGMMDPMMGMMGMGGMGMGMAPAGITDMLMGPGMGTGMGLTDLLMLGGLGFGAYKMFGQ